jgi:hypothetical protein
MKTNRSSQIVLGIVFATATAAFGTGCIAEPGTEHSGTSEEALRNPNPPPDPGPSTYTCGGTSAFTSDSFETALVGLGCYHKTLEQSYGGGMGFFVAGCPSTTATVTAWCPSYGYRTVNLDGLIQCYANVAPYYALANPAGQCASGAETVGWDPTCGGSNCRVPSY